MHIARMFVNRTAQWLGAGCAITGMIYAVYSGTHVFDEDLLNAIAAVGFGVVGLILGNAGYKASSSITYLFVALMAFAILTGWLFLTSPYALIARGLATPLGVVLMFGGFTAVICNG